MALARLKPVNPRRGYKLRRFTTLKFGRRYQGGKWYQIDDPREAEYLAEMCQNGRTREENLELGEDAIPAFDVAADKAEAKLIERSYSKKARRPEPEGGSVDQPVRVHRPGKKDGRKARPRRRAKTSREVEKATTPTPEPTRPGKKPEPETTPDEPTTGDTEIDSKPEETIDELVERRKSEIAKMVDDHKAADLEEMATELDLPASGTKAELASRIWDHQNGGADLEDDDENDDE